MSGTYILRKGKAQLSDLVDGGSIWGYPGPLYPGKNYYVNNRTGSAGASGETWTDAMDQVSVAITASEAHHDTHGNNYNVPNNIFIQGTNTVYTGLTDTGEYANIIGVSAGTMFEGEGMGEVRIGSTTDGDGVVDTSNSIGNSWYNLQFVYGNTGHWGFKNSAKVMRSRFTEITFMQQASAGTGGFNAVAMTGTIIERCRFVTNSGGTVTTYGIYISGQNSDNQIIYNYLDCGTTALLSLGTGSGIGNLIAHNYFSGPTTNAFLDASASSLSFLAGNYFAHANVTTDNISRANDNRNSGNFVAGTADYVST